MDGDGLGLKVKITPEIDTSKLKAEAKKVESTLNKSSDVTASSYLSNLDKLIKKNKDAMRYGDLTKKYGTNDPNKIAWGETYGKSGGPRGKLEGLFEGLGGKMGGGGLGKAAVAGGVAGLAMAGIQGILEILKKMFSLLLEASPSLKAILKMLNQGFMMILRPLGDALAMMLRPIAMFFRVIGRQVMKQMRAKRAELKAEGLSGGALGMALMEEMPTMYLQVLIDALANVNWGDIWNKYLDIVWTNITERFPAFLATLWEGFLGMRDGLINTLAGFGGWLWGVLSDVSKWGLDKLAGFGTWIWNTLTGKIGAMDNLKTVANSIYDVFVTIYNKLADLAGLVGVRVDKLLSSSQQAAFDTSTHDREKSDFYKYHPELAPKADTGADVLQTGYAIIHKGERVLNPSETAAYNAGGGAMNVSISIPGSAISDAIDRRIDTYFRTKVVARR